MYSVEYTYSNIYILTHKAKFIFLNFHRNNSVNISRNFE